ncbi:hypothetical protein ACFVS9_33160 [Streptomyces sp. NPDC058008]|uniref:hypothetical protein n=1 Tax=Streptomyces sp. NPDC058008 TaxID=3346303 RepID=UPI0036E16BDB
MLTEAATVLGAPNDRVHSISSTVGALAGISAFALLEEAPDTHPNTPHAPDAVVCALIGDIAGSVTATHISLRHQRPTS